MVQGFIKIFIFVILYNSISFIYCGQAWNYDLTDIKFTTSDVNIFNAKYEIERISRGLFGISGFTDIKQPLDDRSSIEMKTYRDTFCNKNYIIQPYSLSNTTLTDAMNDYYKTYLMENLKECGENAPYFEKFTPPLGPLNYVLNKCQISTDNMPSYMNEGCYMILVVIHGQVEVNISIYFVVEHS